MMRMNTDTYYRLLNWGLKLAAGAGSATGFKDVPIGYNRSYVRVRKDASIEDFYRAWAEGRNFVTNGPVLFLEAESGEKPGDTIALPEGGGKVRVQVTALSDLPVRSLELVVNGEVAFESESLTKNSGLMGAAWDIKQGSWIAARCTAIDNLLTDEELATYANGEREQPSRLRYAHTSPIYVSVGGKGAAVQSSIEEGFRMLDQFEVFARKTASKEHLQPILEATRKARTVLEKRAATLVEPEG
jgi:hypothetical protein